MAQQQVQRTPAEREQEAKELAELDAAARTDEQQDLIDVADDILDEIDAALEGLDQDLAVQYRQKGGQ